jgi:2-haloacid dehalogenase
MAAGVVAFDVNETLLDLAALDPLFERHLGDAAARPLWFGQMLQLAFVGIATGEYVDFTTAQHAALRMLARRRGTRIGDDAAEEIVGAMSALPPHPDVPGALARLRDAGVRTATLTNSPLGVARAQLESAGIADRFDAILSADDVKALKPRPEAYHHVAHHFEAEAKDVRLVAAHAWDVSGALAAGCQAAFVRRPGKVPSPIGPQPDIVGDDLIEVAEKIL